MINGVEFINLQSFRVIYFLEIMKISDILFWKRLEVIIKVKDRYVCFKIQKFFFCVMLIVFVVINNMCI